METTQEERVRFAASLPEDGTSSADRFAASLIRDVDMLEEALEEAQQWLAELREHFERGSLHDRSGLGGTLSNLTVDAEAKARAVLAPKS